MVRVTEVDAVVGPFRASAPEMVKVLVPTVVGVPVISPVVASRESPSGRAPAVTDQLYDPSVPIPLGVAA